MNDAILRRVLTSTPLFARVVLSRILRPYQLEPLAPIVDSILYRRGFTFTVMYARQMGKNELSAILEAYLLTLYQHRGGSMVKAAPTLRPQLVNSMLRLDAFMENGLTQGQLRARFGYMLQLGQATLFFFSGQPSSQVVGATASLLLEIDEAQDFNAEKYAKDFRPMGATGNATTILWGTSWDGTTLLEQTAAENQALEAQDGIRRHFAYAWEAGAAANPHYRAYVETERQRLGAEHPLFQTQYALRPVAGTGRLFGPAHLTQLQGTHPRERQPAPGAIYVAGLDCAGEEEAEPIQGGEFQPFARRDSVVLTLARMTLAGAIDAPGVQEPHLDLVEHYAWTGRKHRELIPQLVDLLKRIWQVRYVVVDATGVGGAVASFLVGALGEQRVTSFVFTAQSKSALVYGLLAAVNAGRIRHFADDHSSEYAEFWRQARAARYAVRAHQAMTFEVSPTEGHDDFLVALALAAEAARVSPLRRATGHAQPRR
jgi:hypothetical protein